MSFRRQKKSWREDQRRCELVDRRSFFKVMAAVGAAVAAPQTFLVPAEAAVVVPVGATQVGVIREMFAYDISRDVQVARYDVWASATGVQLSYGTEMHGGQMHSLDAIRLEAKEALERAMTKHGLAWSDLSPLPIPKGYRGTNLDG